MKLDNIFTAVIAVTSGTVKLASGLTENGHQNKPFNDLKNLGVDNMRVRFNDHKIRMRSNGYGNFISDNEDIGHAHPHITFAIKKLFGRIDANGRFM